MVGALVLHSRMRQGGEPAEQEELEADGEGIPIIEFPDLSDLAKPNKAGEIPALVLVPEGHFLLNTEKARERLKAKIAGKAVYASEGVVVNSTTDPSTVGVEDPLAYHFGNHVIAYHQLRPFLGKNTSDMSLEEGLHILSYASSSLVQPETEKLWKGIRPKVEELSAKFPEYAKFTKLMDGLYEQPDIVRQKSYFEENQRQWVNSFAALAWFLQGNLAVKLRELKDTPAAERPDLTVATKLVNDQPVSDDEVISAYSQGYREKKLAHNAAEGFVKAAKDEKSFYLSVGAEHVAPLYRFLRKSFNKAGGKKIPITIEHSVLESETDPEAIRETKRFQKSWSKLGKK